MKHLKDKRLSKRTSADGSARARYLVQAIELEENKTVYHLSATMGLVSFLVFGVIAWSAFVQMPEIAAAAGEVIPQGRVHKIQHRDGGTVTDIRVRNGDTVEAGDILMVLDNTDLNAQRNSLNSAKVDLLLRMDRLQALLDKREPRFQQFAANYPMIVGTQANLYKEQVQSDKEHRNSIARKIQNRKNEFKTKNRQQVALKEEVAIYRQQSDMRRSLYKKKQVSKADMLEASARLASAKNRLEEVEGEWERISHTINELEQEQTEYESVWRESLHSERSEVVRQLTMTEEQIKSVESQLARLEIKAQIKGVITGLEINSINAVVGPAEVLMELVPLGNDLLVEAKLMPEDVGHVVIGLPVNVKVSSFEFQRFGSIPGEVRKVSANTYIDADNTPYYLAEIALAKNFVGDIANVNNIVPGMVVQADIITGEKSILTYILKPLHRGLEGAFSER